MIQFRFVAHRYEIIGYNFYFCVIVRDGHF